MKIYLQQAVLLWAAIFFTATSCLAATPHKIEKDSDPISFGFFPIISTVALFKRFSPLRDYLASELQRPVALETAKNFPTFLQRTADRQYDILVTAPHFALKAADSGQYKVIATLTANVQQFVVVRNNSKLSSVSDLAGRVIATPPQSALMTKMGKQFLSDSGLTGAKEPVYRSFTSHNAANEAVIAGEADAAIASSNIIKKALKQGKPLRVIGKGLSLPNMATLIASDMESELGEKIASILVNMNKSDQGRQVLQQIAFPGYRRVDASEYELARPYMEKTPILKSR